MEDLEKSLASVNLFSGLTAQGLTRVAALANETSLARGVFVFKEGERGDKLYIILEGKIRISRTVPGMGEEALAILGPGEAFGEMSLIDEFPRSADAIVHERCRLLEISREALDDLLLIHRDLAYEILWNFVKILSTRLRETNDKMTFLSITGKF
jgi:CRP/FNR family transcriptional regulator, cyclic AMP receptor protein